MSESKPDKKAILNQLRTTGYSIIPDYLSKEECQTLKKHVDICMRKYSHKVQRDFKEDLGGDYRLFGLERTNETIYNILHNNEYFDVLKEYAGVNTTPCTVLANILKADPKHPGKILNSGGGWHRDPGTQHCTKVKTILYLTDVDTNSGPFTIIPSSRKSDVGLGTVRDPETCPPIHRNLRICDSFVEELEEQGRSPVEVLGKAGTLILVDVGNIHRGKPIDISSCDNNNTTNERYALTNYFGTDQRSSDSFKRNKTHFIGS